MQVYTGVEVSAGSGRAKCSEGRAQEVERQITLGQGKLPRVEKELNM